MGESATKDGDSRRAGGGLPQRARSSALPGVPGFLADGGLQRLVDGASARFRELKIIYFIFNALSTHFQR